MASIIVRQQRIARIAAKGITTLRVLVDRSLASAGGPGAGTVLTIPVTVETASILLPQITLYETATAPDLVTQGAIYCAELLDINGFIVATVPGFAAFNLRIPAAETTWNEIREANDFLALIQSSIASRLGLDTFPSVGQSIITVIGAASNVGLDTISLLFGSSINPPGIRRNIATAQMEVSHDGLTWSAIGSGGGSGTVTSVGLSLPSIFSVSGSPVTVSGTLAATFTNQTANLVFAGPTSGGAAAPTFRALVAADYPTMVGDSGAGGVKGAVPAPAAGDAAANKFLKADGTWTAIPSAPVTSVFGRTGAVVAQNGDYSFSQISGTVADGQLSANVTLLGNTVTGTGAIVLTNSPTLVTPTIASFANANHTHADAAGGGQLNATNIFNAGTIPVARLPLLVGDSGAGGTAGLAPAPAAGDAAANKFLKADGTWTAVVSASPAGSGSELQARLNATTFQAVTGSSTSSGNVSLVGQAVAGGATLFDLTPGAHTAVAVEVPNFVVRANTITTNSTVADYNFNKFLAPTLASNSARTTTNAATVYINNAPTAGTNITITNPYALWVDAGNTRLDGFLGVGVQAPANTQFYVQGQSSGFVTAQIDSASGTVSDIFLIRRGTTNVFQLTSGGKAIFTSPNSGPSIPYFRIDTSPDTILGSAEVFGIKLGGDSTGATVTRQFTSSFATQREYLFAAPTYSMVNAAQTITTAATVTITGAPVASTNLTITNPLALWTQSGANQFQRDSIGTTSTDGLILINSAAAAAGAQQFSPRLRLTASGWKTNATAGAQAVDWTVENQPVQGAANPTGDLAFYNQVNGGGYIERFRLQQPAAAGIVGAYFNNPSNGSYNLVIRQNSTASASFEIVTTPSNFAGLAIHAGNNHVTVGNGGVLSFATNMSIGDAILRRVTGANLAFGATDAAPASVLAQTISVQNVVGGSTDGAGQPFFVRGSLGTSQGVPGRIHIQTGALIAASGSTQQTAVDRHIFGASKVLTNNTTTTVCNVTVASNTAASGIVSYTVEVFDGTDVQVETGEFVYQVTNKGGTIANNTITFAGASGVGVTSNYPVKANTSGTLTVTWTISAANPALLAINANSSLTPSTGYPRVTYSLRNHTQQAVAIQ